MSEIVSTLKSLVSMDNIAEEADLSTDMQDHDQVLETIGGRVLTGFNEDLGSMSEWLDDVRKVEDLASLISKKKSYPLPNSANIKFPLITKACYEFSSRTYPEVVKEGKVVKGRVIGFDFTDHEKQVKCERVTDYMNYQLLMENEEWELGFDRLLNLLGLIGFICRKSYYDPVRKVIKSVLCDYKDLIINSDVTSLDDARRISHVVHLRLNDLVAHANAGIFCEEVVQELKEQHENDILDPTIDIIEQHTFLDLDEDGYAEPYIVTIVKESGKVLRILARFKKDAIESKNDKIINITPIQSFTDYHFLVSPKGKFQSVGFGILMLHLNESINSILNQLVDAGQLANMQGGFRDSRLKDMGSGDSRFDPGEWKLMKAMAGMTLKEGILPHQYKEPSSVLFQLLGLLIQTGKDLSSSTEVMTGATNVDNAKTGAVNQILSQGLKVFTAIQRRIYRSLTSEFKKIYALDSEYLDPKKYFNMLGLTKVVFKDDFDQKVMDIIPIADPNLSSDAQRSSRNQILLAAQQLPGTNKIELSREVLSNSDLNIPVDKLMMTPEQMNQPSPEVIKIQADIQSMAEDKKLKAQELEIKQYEAKVEFYKVQCQCLELKSQAMLNLAKAESLQNGDEYQKWQMQLDALNSQMEQMHKATEYLQNAQQHESEMQLAHKELDNANKEQSDQGMAE